MDYDNFNIRVSQYDQIRRGWPVFVSSSAGERPGFMPDTLFRRDEIMRYRENFYKILESLRRQETYRVYLPPNEQFIRDVGKILFETLIQGRIYHLYIRSKQCAADKDHRFAIDFACRRSSGTNDSPLGVAF